MSVYKKTSCIIVVIILLGGIICLIASSVSGHIKKMYDLYASFDETLRYISFNINKSVGGINFKKSFNLDLENHCSSNPKFSSFNISNDASEKHIGISVKNLKFKDNNINMNTYVGANDVGFYFDHNPNSCYSMKSDNFRTKWNESIYSKIYKMPEFVPDDLNYDKAASFFTGKNILKSAIALNFSSINAKPDEFINNVRITRNSYKKGIRIYHVSVSKEYIKNIFEKLKKSSDKSYLKILNPYITDIDDFLDKSDNKNIDIKFRLQNKIVTHAEASLKKQDGIYNISVNISEGITLAVKELKDNTNLYFARLITEKNILKLLVSDKNSLLFTANFKKINDNLHSSDIAFLDKSDNINLYKATFSDNPKSSYVIREAKNIYSMSVSELVKLYKLFNTPS